MSSSACNALNFFSSRILRSEALIYNSHFFLNSRFKRKLFDIRFSYKHRNFSRVCLFVKMASKTVTRSIGGPIRETEAGTSA